MTDTTNQETKNIIKAWYEASEDLSIEIESPFYIEIKNNMIIKYGLLVKYFGSKLGTLIITTDDLSEFDTAEEFGYYCSALNPFHYCKYNREHFIKTLTDWEYYGPINKKPFWYTKNPVNNS